MKDVLARIKQWVRPSEPVLIELWDGKTMEMIGYTQEEVDAVTRRAIEIRSGHAKEDGSFDSLNDAERQVVISLWNSGASHWIFRKQ